MDATAIAHTVMYTQNRQDVNPVTEGEIDEECNHHIGSLACGSVRIGLHYVRQRQSSAGSRNKRLA